MAVSGKQKEAVAKFEKIIRQQPGNTQALINIATVYGNAGNYAKALEFIEKYLAINPDDKQVKRMAAFTKEKINNSGNSSR